jgi:hypothetical protein
MKFTDVSGEYRASIFRIKGKSSKKPASCGTLLATCYVLDSCLAYFLTLKMEAVHSCGM